MQTADEILEQQRRDQAERDAEIQRQQEQTRQQIASNAQASQQQFGLGNGINNGMSGVRSGRNLASMFGTTGSVPAVSSSYSAGGTAVGSVEGMSGAWGSVGGASSGGAAGGGGATGGLAAAGPWAALAAAVIGHNEWADRKGLRDGESFKGEFGLTGRALYKDKDYYAERADKIIPGLGDSVNIGGSLSSPADMFRGETWKGAAKSALKGGVVGGLLRKIF